MAWLTTRRAAPLLVASAPQSVGCLYGLFTGDGDPQPRAGSAVPPPSSTRHRARGVEDELQHGPGAVERDLLLVGRGRGVDEDGRAPAVQLFEQASQERVPEVHAVRVGLERDPVAAELVHGVCVGRRLDPNPAAGALCARPGRPRIPAPGPQGRPPGRVATKSRPERSLTVGSGALPVRNGRAEAGSSASAGPMSPAVAHDGGRHRVLRGPK